jgi:protein-S-isoprenylcysteine O-methyltransferase Ste14
MKHIKRHRIRDDLIFFAIPALVLFSSGLLVSFLSGPNSFAFKMENIIRQPAMITQLTGQNFFGLILFISGFAILISAQVTLGRNYSSTLVIRDDHNLITHGIYHYIRHPIYLGVILISIGIAVFSYSFPGLLIMLALIPVFLIRIRLEEKLLIEEFGQSYRDYQMATRKLLPLVF